MRGKEEKINMEAQKGGREFVDGGRDKGKKVEGEEEMRKG